MISIEAVLAASAISAGAAQGWSERGVFAFDGPFMADFRTSKELVMAPTYGRLRDCSDVRFYCAAGDKLQLVLPRRCADLNERRWSAGGIITVELGKVRRERTAHHASRTELLLGSPASKDVVYVYREPVGVTAVILSKVGQEDAQSMARSGRLAEEILKVRSEFRSQPYFTYSLITTDPMGACT